MQDFKPQDLDSRQHHRVSLTCEIETPEGREQVELPFTVGVLGDFSGNLEPDSSAARLSLPPEALRAGLPVGRALKRAQSSQQGQGKKPLRERRFVDINSTNISSVMASIRPGLSFRVKNRLLADGGELQVSLKFSSLADFTPARIVGQVPFLARLHRVRCDLASLKHKPDRMQQLQAMLRELQNSDPELLEYLRRK
ncbi:type VI secretion system contractile sheath small subunit [Spongorhabdus nitratireducens]